jgi:uncharacterized protein
VFRQGVRAGVASYSLKALEPCFGYERELDLREASRSLRAIEAALELGDREALDPSDQALVEAYNRDDCVATWRLRDWLEARRCELVAGGAAIPRPLAKSGEPPKELDKSLQEVRELADRLLTGIPADREARSNEQQACWILAQLLEWHRREDKVSWWELFRLADLDDEERLDRVTRSRGSSSSSVWTVPIAAPSIDTRFLPRSKRSERATTPTSAPISDSARSS